jgi:hypothetical protein
MNVQENALPQSIVREARLLYAGGKEFELRDERREDNYNLSTGEVRVARIMQGIRYDTTRATLVVGDGEFSGNDSYRLRRLYRTKNGTFFLLQMLWSAELGFIDRPAIVVVEDEAVLGVAKGLLRGEDILPFMLDWYCAGLLPLDDAYVQRWAEAILSADKCEAVLSRFGKRRASRQQY